MSNARLKIFSDRFQMALDVRGINQSVIASRLKVSSSTISKWKNGLSLPNCEMLNELSNVLDVNEEWFSREIKNGYSSPLFRKQAKTLKNSIRMLNAKLHWAVEMFDNLAEYVDFPDMRLPLLEFYDPEHITQDDIEHAAEKVREVSGLGRLPVPNLALLAEKLGVIVISCKTGTPQIEGLSSWSESTGRPFIFLSSDKENGFRSRFDLAHELGHLVLHKFIKPDVAFHNYRLMEEQAHAFSGALLLPAEGFSNEIKVPVTLDSLLPIKLRWGISVGAVIMRLYNLGLINENEKKNLFKRRSYRWGAKSEPFDDSKKLERPRLIRQAIEAIINDGLFDKNSLVSYLGIHKLDICLMAGINEAFFDDESNVKFVDFSRKDTSKDKLKKFKSGEVVELGYFK